VRKKAGQQTGGKNSLKSGAILAGWFSSYTAGVYMSLLIIVFNSMVLMQLVVEFVMHPKGKQTTLPLIRR